MSASEIAERLEKRVRDLMWQAQASQTSGGLYDPEPQPRLFPGVAWPFEWLIEALEDAGREAVAEYKRNMPV